VWTLFSDLHVIFFYISIFFSSLFVFWDFYIVYQSFILFFFEYYYYLHFLVSPDIFSFCFDVSSFNAPFLFSVACINTNVSFNRFFFSYNYLNLLYFFNYIVSYNFFRLKVDTRSFFFLDMYIESYRLCQYYQYIFNHSFFLNINFRRYYIPSFSFLYKDFYWSFIKLFFHSMFIDRVFIFFVLTCNFIPFIINTSFLSYIYLRNSRIGSFFSRIDASHKRLLDLLHFETVSSYLFYLVYVFFMSHSKLYYMERWSYELYTDILSEFFRAPSEFAIFGFFFFKYFETMFFTYLYNDCFYDLFVYLDFWDYYVSTFAFIDFFLFQRIIELIVCDFVDLVL